jgi:hypothetical protein
MCFIIFDRARKTPPRYVRGNLIGFFILLHGLEEMDMAKGDIAVCPFHMPQLPTIPAVGKVDHLDDIPITEVA